MNAVPAAFTTPKMTVTKPGSNVRRKSPADKGKLGIFMIILPWQITFTLKQILVKCTTDIYSKYF